MFFEQKLQSQLVQEELSRSSKQISHRVHNSKEPISVGQRIKKNARAYIVLFLGTSSIHGLNHLVAARRHPLEVLLWFTVVGLSLYGAVSLSRTTWIRYQSSPTVVSMDRDMFAWNTTFPCVTICPDTKLDEKMVLEYVQSHPEQDKEVLEKFIRALANSTYDNFENIPDYNGIAAENYMNLILNLTRVFKPTLTIGASGISLKIIPTITEMGVCYAVNSKVALYNTPEPEHNAKIGGTNRQAKVPILADSSGFTAFYHRYWKENRWDLIKNYSPTFFVHPLDGEVFAQVINLSTSYNVYIHGPLEVPDISTKRQHSAVDFYMKLYVTALSVYTADEAAKLSVNQRRCRFYHENNLKHNAVYTYNTCRMECRIRLCLQYCQCIPHFYRRVGSERICDVKGLKCLSKYKEELNKLQDPTTKKKINCGCLPICDDVNFVIQSNVLQEWFLGTNLQWGIVTYPRMRYRRDIIFGFTDVLVSVGGMAGLFLGCSVLSFMEIVYFLTLRLVCYTRSIHAK